MATEADIPYPVSRPKEVEAKELMGGELSDIIVSENDMVIPIESKNGEHEVLAKKEPEETNGTHCTVSITEDQPESDSAVCEKIGEAQKQDNGPYAEEETPFVAKTTEERTTEMGDDSVSAKNMGSAGIEKESVHNDALEKEMNTPPQMNNENDVSSTIELENCSDIGKSESSNDEKSSYIVMDKDRSAYEMTVNEVSEGPIMELEESTKNFEGISKESAETEKASAEFEADGDTHGSDATESQSISTSTEKDIKSVEGENPTSAPESTVEDKSKRASPETSWTNIEDEINNYENQTTNPIKEQESAKQLLREIKRGNESVINKEQTMEEESCSKELHLIAAKDKKLQTMHKVADLHLTTTQGLQVEAPESPLVMDKSKVAYDLNQELEAPPPRKAQEEERVIEKPVDLPSSESLASEDKIITEKIEETDDCNDKTDIAPSVVTDESILGEANLNDEVVKILDTSLEAKGPEMVKTADTRQQDAEIDSMKLEKNSIMVSDLPTHEHEKAEMVGLCEEKSDAIDFEVGKVPDAVSESEVQGAKENDESEIVTSIMVGEIDTSKIEEQIRNAPEALSEQLNQVVKSDGKGEIAPEQILQAEKIATLCNEEDSETETKATIEKAEDGYIKKEDTEVETNEIEEKNEGPTEALSEPTDQGVEAASKDEIAAGLTLQAEKKEEQLQVSLYALPSNDENAETTATIEQTEDGCKRNEDAEDDRNEIEDASERLSEPIDQFVEATAKDENAPSPTLQDEKIKEQSQVTSSVMLSEEDGGTTTTTDKTVDGCTQKDDTEVDTSITTDSATPGVVSQALSTTCECANNAIVAKSDADLVKFEETETLQAVSEPNGMGFEEIHESDTSSTAEINDTGKTEEEIKANETISDQGSENGTTIEKIEDGRTKKVEVGADNIELEEITVMFSEFPLTENAIQERVNKVTDLDQTATQGHPTERNKSEVAGDLNQEIEATPLRKALEEEIQVIEKPVNLSSTEFLATDEKINEEKKEETKDFDNKTDIAQASVMDVSILGEVNLNDEPAKAFGTISDAKTPKTVIADDSSQQDDEVDNVNCEDALIVVSCLPTHKHEEADKLSIHGEKSDAIESNVEANKIADAESESKVQGAEEIYETDRSLTVGETDTNDIEEQIRDAPEALCEPITQGVKPESKDETALVQTLQAEKIEEQRLQVSSSDLLPKDEDGKITSIVEKTEDECAKKDDEEVETNEIEDASKAVSEPINQGVEATSKDENIPSSTLQGETIEEHPVDSNEIEEQRGDALEALYKLINQGVEAASNDEIAPGPIHPQAEKTEEQLQVSSSAMAFNEEDDETQTLSEPIKQGVEAASKDESIPTPTSQGETMEKHRVETNEIDEQTGNALNALYELINRRVEAASNDEVAPGLTLQAERTEEQLQVSSYAMVSNEEEDETQTTAAWTEDGCKRRDDMDAETNGEGEQTVDARETLSEPINQGVEADCSDEIALGPTIEAKETQEQLQVLSSVVLSNEESGETATMVEKTEDGCTKRDETEVVNLELEETPGVVSQPLTTTCESANNAIVKSDKVDEKNTLQAVSEPKDLDFEEIHESQKSPTAEITDKQQVVENGTTIKKIEGESTTNAEAEVDNTKLEEATAMLSQFPTNENEVAVEENATVEKSEGNEFEEAKFSDVVSESELHGAAKESTTEDKTQVNENAADSFEAGATEKPTFQNEELRELYVSTTENEVVDKEGATVEKSEGNEFHAEAAKVSDAVCASKLHGAATESTKEDETQVNENAADSFEAGATEKPTFQNEELRELYVSTTENEVVDKEGATVEKSEGNEFHAEAAKVSDAVCASELHGAATESTKEDETQVNENAADSFEAGATEKPTFQNEELRELYVSTTENEVVDKEGATVEKSEGNEFHAEAAKVSDAVCASELHGAATESTKEDETQVNENAADSFEAGATEKSSLQNEEPRELDVSTTETEVVDKESATVEKSEGNEFHLEEEKVSDAVSESELHGAAKETTKEDETQLNEKAADSFEAGEIKKPSLQNEELRELDVSNFDQMARNDSPNQAPEQERRSIEDDSEVKPQGYIPEAKYAEEASEHEKAPGQCSLEETSKYENAIDLLPPHPTIKELSTEEGEAVKNDTSMEKITEDKEMTRISLPVSPHEETVTKTNHENGQLDSPKREDKTTAEPFQGEESATFEKQSEEIQREELFDKQTAAVTASIVEGGKGIQIENHTMDEDTVELSTNGNDSNLVEPKIHIVTTPNGDEESHHLNEKLNVLSDGKDTEAPHEKTITDYGVTKDTKDLEIVEYGREKKTAEGCQETEERSVLMDTDKSTKKKSFGSKVKHSIAKVKKVLTGKSSYPKASSPP